MGLVSVVMMAFEVSSHPDGESFAAASVTPIEILLMSRNGPITPVDMTRERPKPFSLIMATVASESCSPLVPVQALAQPLLMTTEEMVPGSSASIFLHTRTGAAQNLLVVNTAAAELKRASKRKTEKTEKKEERRKITTREKETKQHSHTLTTGHLK